MFLFVCLFVCLFTCLVFRIGDFINYWKEVFNTIVIIIVIIIIVIVVIIVVVNNAIISRSFLIISFLRVW